MDKNGLCNVLRSFRLDPFIATSCDSFARAELLSHIFLVFTFHDRDACEGLLSQEERFAALQGMARGRTSGCDGLSVKFWHVLGYHLVVILNSALLCLVRRWTVLTLKTGVQSPF